MKRIIKLTLIVFLLFLPIVVFWQENQEPDPEQNVEQCAPEKVYTISQWLTWCCPGEVVDWACQNNLSDVWITINTQCLTNWQCGLNVYKVLWIRQSSGWRPSVSLFFEDIVLAATSFVWTVITIALIISGLIFAFWSITGKDTKKAKTIMIDCFVWLLLVMWSYTIIRLIQFVAKAWWWS